jgi:hypothetical protein
MPGVVVVAPPATPARDRAGPHEQARERSRPVTTRRARAPRPTAPPEPVPDNLVAATAGVSASAPPAVACALFAASAALTRRELRRFKPRLAIPDAPGVPSLRDRPG